MNIILKKYLYKHENNLISNLQQEKEAANLAHAMAHAAKSRTSTGKSLSEALLFAEHGENMLCTKIVLNVKTISVLNMFFPGLSQEFSNIELVIQ